MTQAHAVKGRWTGRQAALFCQAWNEIRGLSKEQVAQDVLGVAPRSVYVWQNAPSTVLRPGTQRQLTAALQAAPIGVRERFAELCADDPDPAPAAASGSLLCRRVAGQVGALDAALAVWATRDNAQAQPEVRQAASAALDAMDAVIRVLYDARRDLVAEIRQADAAADARIEALLANVDGNANAVPRQGRTRLTVVPDVAVEVA